MYWFPHTDRMLVKRNDRLGTDLSEAEPLSRCAVLARRRLAPNTLFGALTDGRQPASRRSSRGSTGSLAGC